MTKILTPKMNDSPCNMRYKALDSETTWDPMSAQQRHEWGVTLDIVLDTWTAETHGPSCGLGIDRDTGISIVGFLIGVSMNCAR